MPRKLLFLVLLLLGIGLVLWLEPGRYLNVAFLQAELDNLRELIRARPGQTAAAFFGVYVVITAVSLPGAALLTLAAGALFGVLAGTLLASFASTIGATLAFWTARFLFREPVERRFLETARRINAGIDTEGAYYLFALRLVPLFPFFVVNLAMGLTRLRTWTFCWVSQLGMLPGTLVYVNAGTQLGRIETAGDILSPAVAGSFALLGLFPLLARRLLGALRHRRLYRRFHRPARFDANLVVIGAGAAGLVTAYVAAAARAKVVLVEAERMGGDCLNRGCVPSKALLRSARLASLLRRAPEFGLRPVAVATDFPAVMDRVRSVIGQVAPHDSVARYTALGVECVQGRAVIASPWTVVVGDRTITTRSIVIATGGRPALPPVPGLAEVPHVTSDTVWDLSSLPRRLLVLGGGAVGCELAQAFARLGAQVTLLERLPRLLDREEPEAAAVVAGALTADGVRVLTGWEAESCRTLAEGGELTASSRATGQRETLTFDVVLVATGRRPDTAGLGLEALGVALNPDGTVAVNEFLQATYPNVYACGDVAGPWQLTHAASHQAWYCAMNGLYGRWWRLRVDYRVIPRAIYTDPEVASVGLSEVAAADEGYETETATYALADLDRAIAEGETRGFVKVVTAAGRDRILGVTVVGARAGDIISEFVLAMRHGLGLRKVLATVHSYPTFAEANKYAAGVWQRQHLPAGLLGLAARLNRWQRSG